MHKSDKSPVVGYKIAIVNNANLSNQFKVIVPEQRDEEGNVIVAERVEKQFEYASKRMLRAIRKARLMLGSHKHVQLFGIRKDGTFFPVSLKKRDLKVAA